MHGVEFDIVLILCGALTAGAATRFCLRRTPIPYTLALMLLGAVVGWGLRAIHMDLGEGEYGHSGGALGLLVSGQVLSPGLILFVFLPALVFESAFSLDPYVVRRQIGAISVLALPAMVACTLLAAAWMQGLTTFWGWTWGWTGALVFGALISATDPVAVVALMRSVGAPKRLGTLVEGESLFNDGTAIVLFTVLLAVLDGSVQGIGLGDTVLRFAIVVAGGVAVGVVLASITSAWIGRTFNDPLVEIALTLVLAYAAMAIAEGLLHVSGVIAVVTVGLWMAGRGKTEISPEVGRFLHKFWGFLSYCANTLIFLLVGLVIAVQIHGAVAADLLLCVLTFLGLLVIRSLVVFVVRPLFSTVGDPVSSREALVLSWSGLRGAVSLALALAVNQTTRVPEEIREQILLVTGGVVFLTMLVNGSSTGWLLRRLGFNRPPLGVQLARLTTEAGALHAVQEDVEQHRRSRLLPLAPWGMVEEELEGRVDAVHASILELEGEIQRVGESSSAGYWRQALAVERDACWSDYGRGITGVRAIRILDHEFDLQLDRVEHGDLAPPARRLLPAVMPRVGLGWLLKIRSVVVGGRPGYRMRLVYELAQAECRAAAAVLASLKQVDEENPEVLLEIESTYLGYLSAGLGTLEDMRANLPEVTRAIEAHMARRISLNTERARWESLGEHGALDAATAELLLADVERRMVVLEHSPVTVAEPGFEQLCRATDLFGSLSSESIALIEELSGERFVAPGEMLFVQGGQPEALYLVARGVIEILRRSRPEDDEPRLFDVRGPGSIIGEMALLANEPLAASARARTAATVTCIGRAAFLRILAERPDLEEQVWHNYAVTRLCLLADITPELPSLDLPACRQWIEGSEALMLTEGEEPDPEEGRRLYLIHGSLVVDGQKTAAPVLFPGGQSEAKRVAGRGGARVRFLGRPPGEGTR